MTVMRKISIALFAFLVFTPCVKGETSDKSKKLEKMTLEIMLESLSEHTLPLTRQKIIRRISILNDKRAVSDMIYILLNPDEHIDTRREAAKAAMALGGEVKFAPILKILDGTEFHCKKNIRALEEISDERFIFPLMKYSTLEGIKNSCRISATRGYLSMMSSGSNKTDFSRLKGTKGEIALVSVAKRSRGFVLINATFVLGELKSQKAQKALIKLLDHKNYSVKTASLKALAKIKGKESLKPVTDLMKKSPSVSLKKDCVKSLIKMGTIDALESVEQSYLKGSFRHKLLVLKALKSIKTKKSQRMIKKLLAREKIKDRKELKAKMNEGLWD